MADLEPVVFGTRLRLLRLRRGMTQEVLAGLVGKSVSWVKSVESGRLQTPKLPTLLRLAEAMRVRDLSELTGDALPPGALFAGPGHARLSEVRAALDTLKAPRLISPPPSVALVRARLDSAWAVRHASSRHRDALGMVLPGLLADAQLVVQTSDSQHMYRAASAALCETYALAQFFCAYQPAADLVWRLVDRQMVAAINSDDPRAIGLAAWMSVQAHREATNLDAADDIAAQAVEILQSRMDDANTQLRSIYGSLLAETGVTTARRGHRAEAWRALDAADQIARSLPTDWTDPVTAFGRGTVGMWSTTVAVELHTVADGVRQAQVTEPRSIPSRPRRARHLIEAARAHDLAHESERALNLLDAATKSAVETVRYNGHARALILKHSAGKSSARRRQASVVSQRAGLLSG